MFSRVCAAACAAALVVGAFAPAESAARGGAAIGHVGGFHAGGSRPLVRSVPRAHTPFAHTPFAHGPFARARHAPFARFPGAVARAHALRAAALRHRGATFGFGAYGFPITYADDAMFYGSYYDPSDVVGSVSGPAYADPPADSATVAHGEVQVVDRGGCRSETVAVPSSPSERGITITRC